jgi:DNA-binding MarR family transcriptional regulator
LTPNPIQPGDQQVLDYIATHDGTISLSQAAQDLSMSPGALGLTIERLKAAGFLKPA